MDVTPILEGLNEAQREAVSSDALHRLVLAGAGSGKTRVLVHRIAWLVDVEQISPHSILSVTFTNKAAKEMRDRIENMLALPSRQMWVGTFHGLAHRLLSQHWQEAKLPQGFQVMDSDDQQRMIKRLILSMGLDETRWPAKQACWFINGQKDEGTRAAFVEDSADPFIQTQKKIYLAYEQACEQMGVLDFGELLLRAHELWLNNPELLLHYRRRFRHILVDEFQDTNGIQYAWLRVLAGNESRMTVVGDDDQSIYGWRGARIENIRNFETDFPGTQVIRLEQNYRSTSTILKAANTIIARNSGRLGKKLWTDGEDGEPISLYSAFNEGDEARFVAEHIQRWVDTGNARKDAAILYRSNAQSRVLEESLLRLGIPYRIYGGQRFYERLEIKNVLAYLYLMANPHNDAAFERVVNTPTRGVGARTIEQVRECAQASESSLWTAALSMIEQGVLTTRASNALDSFVQIVNDLIRTYKEGILDQENESPTAISRVDTPAMANSQPMVDIDPDWQPSSTTGAASSEPTVTLLNSGDEGYISNPAIKQVSGDMAGLALHELVEEVLSKTKLIEFHAAEKGERGQTRVENLKELVSACQGFATEEGSGNVLIQFLAQAALDAGDTQADEYEDAVQMMTLHSAKGLEFPLVMMTGMEENLFPHSRSADDPTQLEEERRLAYVGVTRAMKKLVLTHAESRRLYGDDRYNPISRFVRDIPAELVQEVRTGGSFKRAVPSSTRPGNSFAQEAPADTGFSLGQQVSHPSFGFGTILNFEGQGAQARVQVNFADEGVKWLILTYARLEPV